MKDVATTDRLPEERESRTDAINPHQAQEVVAIEAQALTAATIVVVVITDADDFFNANFKSKINYN